MFLSLSLTNSLMSMQDLVTAQVGQLAHVFEGFNVPAPTAGHIEKFLENYPTGVSFGRVFSPDQKGALCGVHALQNAFWYRYAANPSDQLKALNNKFNTLLNSISNVSTSSLNGIESEVFERICGPIFRDSFVVIAHQQGVYAPLNSNAMEHFFADGVGFLKDRISKRYPIVSVLMSCSAFEADTYGTSAYNPDFAMDGIASHWISGTILQNANKRVYLMADSLAEPVGTTDGSHTQAFLNFIKAVESTLPDRQEVRILSESVGAQYQMHASNPLQEALRAEWVAQKDHELNVFNIIRRTWQQALTGKNIFSDVIGYIVSNYLKPRAETTAHTGNVEDILNKIVSNGRIVDENGMLQLIDNWEVVQQLLVKASLDTVPQEYKKIKDKRLEYYKVRLNEAFSGFFDRSHLVISGRYSSNDFCKEVVANGLTAFVENIQDPHQFEINSAQLDLTVDGICHALNDVLTTEKEEFKARLLSLFLNVPPFTVSDALDLPSCPVSVRAKEDIQPSIVPSIIIGVAKLAKEQSHMNDSNDDLHEVD